MTERISGLWRQYTVEAICAILAFGIIAFMVIDHVFGEGGTATPASAAEHKPTSQATADAFPSPGKTVVLTRTVRQKDGSIATETVRAYTTIQANGKPLLVQRTVRETAPGVRVTSIRTLAATSVVTAPGSNSTTTAPGTNSTTTAIATEKVGVPGPTVTAPGTLTTLRSTATTTATATVTAVATTTVTATETATATATVTEQVPGPIVTVTLCPDPAAGLC